MGDWILWLGQGEWGLWNGGWLLHVSDHHHYYHGAYRYRTGVMGCFPLNPIFEMWYLWPSLSPSFRSCHDKNIRPIYGLSNPWDVSDMSYLIKHGREVQKIVFLLSIYKIRVDTWKLNKNDNLHLYEMLLFSFFISCFFFFVFFFKFLSHSGSFSPRKNSCNLGLVTPVTSMAMLWRIPSSTTFLF